MDAFTFFSRGKSAPDGEGLKLEAEMDLNRRLLTPWQIARKFQFYRVALRFVPHALDKLRELRERNRELRMMLIAVRKMVRDGAIGPALVYLDQQLEQKELL